MIIRNKHKCVYCGLSIIDQFARPPSWCDHCGNKQFESTPCQLPDYYGGQSEQQEEKLPGFDPNDWDDLDDPE